MFIVIDWVDASWKTTQLQLLAKYLDKIWKTYDEYDFPQYDRQSSFFVKEYLAWKFKYITAQQASLLYALDRFYSKEQLEKSIFLKDFVLSNRYTTSNIIHQATKAKTDKEQENIINFIEYIEYEVLWLPKPDKVIFLDMHIDIARKLNLERWKWKWRDIHEQNYDYLKTSYLKSLNFAKNTWRTIIKCYDKNKPLWINAIHHKILKVLWI